MALDRTGEQLPGPCPYDCRRGWMTPVEADVQIPCPHCKDHLYEPVPTNDFAERTPSARAQQAINQENRE